MTDLCFDVCLLIISTRAELSVKNSTQRSDIWDPQMWTARTIGNNSRKVMLKSFHSVGNAPPNQCFQNIAPYPFDAAASVYRPSLNELSQRSDRKNALPLKLSRKVNHKRISCLASRFKRMWWWGRVRPLVRSIKRRKKARPGTTTEQQKFNRRLKTAVRGV